MCLNMHWTHPTQPERLNKSPSKYKRKLIFSLLGLLKGDILQCLQELPDFNNFFELILTNLGPSTCLALKIILFVDIALVAT